MSGASLPATVLLLSALVLSSCGAPITKLKPPGTMAAYHAIMRVSNRSDFDQFLKEYGENCIQSREILCFTQRDEGARPEGILTFRILDIVALDEDGRLCSTHIGAHLVNGEPVYPIESYAFRLEDGLHNSPYAYNLNADIHWIQQAAAACRMIGD